MKLKLWDIQRKEYRTDYDYNDMIYEDSEEIKNDLINFHSVDFGGLEEKEFNELSLNGMLMLFDWEVHDSKKNKITN